MYVSLHFYLNLQTFKKDLSILLQSELKIEREREKARERKRKNELASFD